MREDYKKEICGNCDYYKGNSYDGYCRYNPPIMQIDGSRSNQCLSTVGYGQKKCGKFYPNLDRVFEAGREQGDNEGREYENKLIQSKIEKDKKVNFAWGSYELGTGKWHPNLLLEKTPEQQHKENVKNGHHCKCGYMKDDCHCEEDK